MGELKPLYAFINENGEYYRGESLNNYHIRTWNTEKEALAYVNKYRKKNKAPLTLVKLNPASPLEFIVKVTKENLHDETEFGIVGKELL
jgi:hypothetical protein